MGVLGYELLFRDSEVNQACFSDGDQATAEVILNTFMDIGLDEVVGNTAAFINFGRNLIMASYCESLPRDRVIFELLENVEPDEALIRRLGQLRDAGYRIALDDFICDNPDPRLLESVHYVKLDLVATDFEKIKQSVAALKHFPVQLIAEKVETREQFQMCRDIGFDYFQGYFFCKPELVRANRLPVNRLATIRLITKLNNPEIRMKELNEALSQDVSLSYKLLRYANSAVCGLHREVESIGHAAVLVGLERMKIFASLILFSGLVDKPHDVLVTGAARARMCEKLAEALKLSRPDRFFLVGLFSVLDALFDKPLDEIVKTLPLAPEVVNGLLKHEGELGRVLRCSMAFERQDWKEAEQSVNLPPETITQIYQQSLTWSLRSLNAFAAKQSA
jgi:EAL and modified HD-GYP domain-containing signal transduction protein